MIGIFIEFVVFVYNFLLSIIQTTVNLSTTIFSSILNLFIPSEVSDKINEAVSESE